MSNQLKSSLDKRFTVNGLLPTGYQDRKLATPQLDMELYRSAMEIRMRSSAASSK